MVAKLKTLSLLGIDALPVEVEVDVSPAGLAKTVLVGLPERAVKESTHRVERAVVVHELSGRRMTVHRTRLLPAAHVDPSRFDHGHHSPCPTCGRVEGIVEEEVRCPYDDHGACGMMHASQ